MLYDMARHFSSLACRFNLVYCTHFHGAYLACGLPSSQKQGAYVGAGKGLFYYLLNLLFSLNK